jgi:hypothetical protein
VPPVPPLPPINRDGRVPIAGLKDALEDLWEDTHFRNR